MDETTTWSFDRNDLFQTLGFNAKDRKILSNQTDDFMRAIQELAPADTQISPDSSGQAASATSPLYISGTRYHINLTQTAKTALLSSLGIIAKAAILHNQMLLEFSVTLTSVVIAELCRRITRLSNRQRQILEGIFDLKKEVGLSGYWPTTDELSSKLSLPAEEIEKDLKPIIDKVVELDPDTKTWRVLF